MSASADELLHDWLRAAESDIALAIEELEKLARRGHRAKLSPIRKRLADAQHAIAGARVTARMRG